MEVPLWCLGRQWTRLKTPKWTLERIPAILTRLLKALKKGSLMEDTERGQNTSIELYFLYWHLINVFVSHINVVYKRTIGIQERWSDYVFSDYRVGSNSCGWSDLFEFSTFPSYDENWSPTLALYGDMGNVNAVSLPTLQKEAQSGKYDLILHVGDFAYDMYNVIANLMMLSTSIYDLVLIYVCHFHQLLLLQSLFKFDHYRDTRAFILDPCIQGILIS